MLESGPLQIGPCAIAPAAPPRTGLCRSSRGWEVGERPAGVVVEMVGLEFRVAGLPLASGSRGEVGGGGLMVVAVRPAAEARRCGSAGGRMGLDPW